MNVLVVNTGGVTIELSIVDPAGRVEAQRMVDPWDGHDVEPIAAFVDDGPGVAAVGHRIVHGGVSTDRPLGEHGDVAGGTSTAVDAAGAVLIDDAVLRRIEEAAPLAPLHQKRALLGIDAARQALPDRPHVACFDTAFHDTMPDVATTYALPAEWRRRWPLRRRGFHGLSHRHVAEAAPRVVSHDANRRVSTAHRRIVSCHLGSGASVCAILDGRSVDTSMGMTPLEGLVMVNRSGSVDPGLVLWLLQHGGLKVDEVSEGLQHRSGLKGLSEGSGDMRGVVQRMSRGERPARLAFDVYMHRLRREIAAMTASLGGVDLLAFTGAVGVHMPIVRAAATEGLAYLGIGIDPEQNRSVGETWPADGLDGIDIGATDAAVGCVVVRGGEHLQIAAAVRDLLGV